jgi:hypothetical protein
VKHIKNEYWITSDGRRFLDYKPAVVHETSLVLAEDLRLLLPAGSDYSGIAEALTQSPRLRIIALPKE